MPPLFPPPSRLEPPASDAQQLFAGGKYQEAIALANEKLAELEKQVPARYAKRPQDAEPGSPLYTTYALTLVLVNALAAVKDWKAAKEALGKYRVRFPKDPWGFRAGAEVTRRDPSVKDKEAVARAAELLDGEAARLEGLAQDPKSG